MTDRPPPPRRRYRRFVAIGLAVIGTFLAGRYWERFTNGRWYQVHDSRAYESPLGRFELRHVTDTAGFPFLDPGTSVVSWHAPTGEVVLYRGGRMFQESYPWVDDLQLEGNDVRWSDGQYRYSLHLDRLPPPTTQP